VLHATQRQPLVLVVENLHWSDATSAAWLTSLACLYLQARAHARSRLWEFAPRATACAACPRCGSARNPVS
jgi:hypothetical protein